VKSARIITAAIDVSSLSRAVASEQNGAIAIFTGTVRAQNDGREVRGIEYSAYEEMAVKEMTRILDEASGRFGVGDIAIEHRIGILDIGDVSIAVAVAHPHRGAALDALRYIVDETKARAPIWKLEHYTDGTREWVNAGSGAR
jgi:molybdopterin synthase catalytic subunit